MNHTATAIGFLNETLGITAGYAGETHYTADGGKTWPKANNQSACRFGLDILNDKLAWTVGNHGNVRVSRDGGQNWTALNNTNKACLVSFVDEKTGWVASRNKLVVTTDGGDTWTDVVLPESVGKFAAVSLRTANDGYILDEKSTLYTTQNGGKTWSSQVLPPLGDKTMNLFSDMWPSTSAVRFTDAEHAIVILSLKNEGIVALRTTDGGSTWTKESVAPKSMFGSIFLTHDGTVLTVASILNNKVMVFRHKSS